MYRSAMNIISKPNQILNWDYKKLKMKTFQKYSNIGHLLFMCEGKKRNIHHWKQVNVAIDRVEEKMDENESI